MNEQLDAQCPYCRRKLVFRVSTHQVMNLLDCPCGATAQAYQTRVYVKDDPSYWAITWHETLDMLNKRLFPQSRPKLDSDWYSGA